MGQDNQGELLTLQMQPSQAHTPPSWFFLDKVTTRVRYYELEDGPHDLGYGFAADLEEPLPISLPLCSCMKPPTSEDERSTACSTAWSTMPIRSLSTFI